MAITLLASLIIMAAYFLLLYGGAGGPHQFGCNKKTHILHFVLYIPACAVLAWICTLL